MAIKLKTTLKFTTIKPYKINVYEAFLLHKISLNFVSKPYNYNYTKNLAKLSEFLLKQIK